jgi:CubicO group peptidase (beta-lactamase class C family)
MDQVALQKQLSEWTEELEVPGVAVGVLIDGEEQYAFHGVTSLENPLPVDEQTLFQFGSTGKTFTATAVMRLVERGELSLDDPVKKHLPDLKLKDPDVAEKVTVLQLLNHTAGWSGDLMDNTGEGDDALEKYVGLMADIEQVSPLGSTVSYNNASLALAGHLIARKTGRTYEAAIKELILDPLGLTNTFFFMGEIMTRRFAVGHNKLPSGEIKIARPWNLPRGGAPAGGMSATAADQIRWGRFHLGNGTADDGTRVLSKELLDLMKEPTADMRGSALGDYVGISWLIRDIEDTRLVGHGGTTLGQHSEFLMVPSRNFAMTSLTNCGPNGPALNSRLEKWALEKYLGIVHKEAEPILLGDEALAPYTGRYESIAAVIDITATAGRLACKVEIRPEVLAQIQEMTGEEANTDQEPILLGLLEEGGDQYVVAEGEAKGMKGYFARNEAGEITGVHLGGRLATRTGPLV